MVSFREYQNPIAVITVDSSGIPISIGSGYGGGSSGSGGDASALKQDELKTEVSKLVSAIAPNDYYNPILTIATSNGFVPQGAKYVSFTFSADFVGTLLGTNIVGIESLDYPFCIKGYGVFPYTVSQGSITIQRAT